MRTADGSSPKNRLTCNQVGRLGYVLRVELQHIKPAIWRRIVVLGSLKPRKLRVVLLPAMGCDGGGGHMHEFVFDDINYGEPAYLGRKLDITVYVK